MSANLPALISAQDLTTISALAKTFHLSGLFSDTKSEAQAMVKIMAGREMGLGPFESMRDINIIQGKTALAAAQIGARIQQSGGNWEPLQFDEKGCVLRFTRDGKTLKPDISFSYEDATKLGLTGKDNYRKQARTMLFWRALTMGARMFFPGVFGGPVYTPDELGGKVMDADFEPAHEPVKTNGNGKKHLEQGGIWPKVDDVAQPPAPEEIPVIATDENPWKHKLEGAEINGQRFQYSGRRLFEMKIPILEKLLKPVNAEKITITDRNNICSALAQKDRADAAAADYLAELDRMDAEDFQRDGVPEFEADVKPPVT